MRVHLHRNLSQRQYMFALGIDPTKAASLFDSIAPSRMMKQHPFCNFGYPLIAFSSSKTT
jgi:hypothetical protein